MRLRVFVTVALMLGCGGEKLPGFGAWYRVEETPRPVLDGGSLVFTARQGSCGNPGKFELHHLVVGKTAQIWARQNVRQPCDMSLKSTIELPVPDEVLAAEEIVLLTPGGGRLSLRR